MVVITRFVILVADVNILGLNDVCLRTVGVDTRSVRILHVAEVAHCGRGERIRRIRIDRMPRGVCLADKYARDARKTFKPRPAYPKACVHPVFFVIDEAEFHRIRAVDENDRLAEPARRLYHFEKICFLALERKDRLAVIIARKIAPLAAGPRKHDYCRVVEIILIARLQLRRIERRRLLADTPCRRLIVGRPSCLAVRICGIQGIVYRKFFRFERVVKTHKPRGIATRAARIASIYGVGDRTPEQCYLAFVSGERQCVTVVLDEHRALFHGLPVVSVGRYQHLFERSIA